MNTKLIQDLENIRRDASMANANFAHIPTGQEFKYPTNEAEVTAFIEERTRIWRNTWIVGMLEEVIKDLKRKAPCYQD